MQSSSLGPYGYIGIPIGINSSLHHQKIQSMVNEHPNDPYGQNYIVEMIWNHRLTRRAPNHQLVDLSCLYYGQTFHECPNYGWKLDQWSNHDQTYQGRLNDGWTYHDRLDMCPLLFYRSFTRWSPHITRPNQCSLIPMIAKFDPSIKHRILHHCLRKKGLV